MLQEKAGTGKTHTAKLAAKARRTSGSFDSVLTVAFSGVAAADVGDGARTATVSSTPTQKTLLRI